jgi:polar amino acid transport system substrate-binding protein
MIEFKPWAFMQGEPQTERIVGVMPDILAEFERRTGTAVNKRLLPYARVEVELERGSCDIALMAWSDRRASYANKGTVFLPLEFGVLAAKGVVLKSYQDLAGLEIGVPRGLSISPEFDNDARLNKQLEKDNLTGILKLVRGRTQAVTGSLLTLRYIIQEAGVTDKFGDALVLKVNDFSAAFSKMSPRVDEQVKTDAVFKEMKADGMIKKIINSWFSLN